MAKRLRSLRHGSAFREDQRGAALVEFALCIFLILTMVFMTLELSSAVYTYTVLADAANEGLRYAIVHSSDNSGAVAKVRAYAALSAHDMSAMTVSVTYPDGSAAPPNRVAVSVRYSYLPYLSVFMKSPPTMSAYAEGRLVY